MHEFESLWILFLQYYTCLARMFHLTEERAEFATSLVVNEGIGKESTAVAPLENPCTQINILAIPHGCKAAQSFINVFLNAEIETSWIELIHFPLAASYATRGEKRGHGVVNGFLDGGERGMGMVGATESIARLTVKLEFYCFQIVFRHDDIGIQYNKVIAMAAFCAVVA